MEPEAKVVVDFARLPSHNTATNERLNNLSISESSLINLSHRILLSFCLTRNGSESSKNRCDMKCE